jgi:serine/threonine-protein kinase HipA
MRKANVYMEKKLAGMLVEDEDGYSFTYDREYLQSGLKPVSLTLPRGTCWHPPMTWLRPIWP